MPRNIRPSWVEIQVDGRRTDTATGPRARTGGMTITLDLRVNGKIQRALTICAQPTDDATATLIHVSGSLFSKDQPYAMAPNGGSLDDLKTGTAIFRVEQ